MPICVRLEYWPASKGPESREEIGLIVIRNESDMADISDFSYQIKTHLYGADAATKIEPFETEGKIKKHYRKQNILQLIKKILNEALPKCKEG